MRLIVVRVWHFVWCLLLCLGVAAEDSSFHEQGLTADEVMQLGRKMLNAYSIDTTDIHSTRASITHEHSNGLSKLGAFDAPTYGRWRQDPEEADEGCPWALAPTNATTPYIPPPITGKVRVYNFTVARGILAPDGVEKHVILVNGEFPGPTIEANWGDIIQVTLNNAITDPEEGTIIHWHGLRQMWTAFEDGVPGVSQTPIPPNDTFTYSFIADPPGTTWYHSHYSAQYSSGTVGALIIHGPTQAKYDEDLGPIMLSDWYHQPYYQVLERVMSNNGTEVAGAVTAQNNLINGRGSYNCSKITNGQKCTPDAGYAQFRFSTGKTYRLRLINAGSHTATVFSIDNHLLTVIAEDFTQVQPYDVEFVTLAIGQRIDVIVTATGSATDSVWMRSNANLTCNLIQQPFGYGKIYYQDADTDILPDSTNWNISTEGQCDNANLEQKVPYPPFPLPTEYVSIDVVVNYTMNATGYLVFMMNGNSFRADYNDPILLAEYNASSNAYQDAVDFPPERNVYRFPRGSRSVRVNIINLTLLAHPMHLHGHANMYVLNTGKGTWDGETIIRPENPMRRDVQVVQPKGYLVVQFDMDLNPGVWPLHCHIVWHSSPGLLINIVVSSLCRNVALLRSYQVSVLRIDAHSIRRTIDAASC